MKTYCILEQGGGTGAALTVQKKRMFTTPFSDFYRLNWKTAADPDAYVTKTGIVWSEGRSYLFEKVPKDYEYYIFIDDDIEFHLPGRADDGTIAERVRDILLFWRPLSGTFYDPDCWVFRESAPYHWSMEREAFPIAAFDLQSFIMHRDFCEITMPIWYHGSGGSMRYINYIAHLLAPTKQLCFTGVLVANTEHALHESLAMPQHNPALLMLEQQEHEFRQPGLAAFDREMRRNNLQVAEQTPDPAPVTIKESDVLELLKESNTFRQRTSLSHAPSLTWGKKLQLILAGLPSRDPGQTVRLLGKMLLRSGKID